MSEEAQFVISLMQPTEVVDAYYMRLESWLEAHADESAGITREWVEDSLFLYPSMEKMVEAIGPPADPNAKIWVAKNRSGYIVGMVQLAHSVRKQAPGLEEIGNISSLCVARNYHGLGIATKLMQTVLENADRYKLLSVGIIDSDERTRSFYREWGFANQVTPAGSFGNSEDKEIPAGIFDHKISTIIMHRKGENI